MISLENIKAHRFYKGQLLPFNSVKKNQESNRESKNEKLNFLLEELDITLFDYQIVALDKLFQSKNIYLVSGYRTGRSSAMEIASIHTRFFQGESILYLLPNDHKLEVKFQRITQRFDRIREKFSQEIVYPDSSEILKEKMKNYPDVILTTAQTFYNTLRQNYTSKTIRDFIFSIGLICLDDVEFYSQIEFIFFTKLINLINTLSSPLIMLSTSIGGDFNTYANLLGVSSNIELIKNRKYLKDNNIFCWLPPFKVELLEDENTFRFRRNSYLDEFKDLITILQDASSDEEINILIWHAYEQLTVNLRDILKINTNIEVVDDLHDYIIDVDFDYIIIIGMPKNFEYLTHNINNFLKDNGYIFIIPPDDLLSYFLLWFDLEWNKLPHRNNYYPLELDFLNKSFEVIKKTVNGKKIPDIYIPYWGVVTDNFIDVSMPSGKKEQIDFDLIPYNYYQGKIEYQDENCYKLDFDNRLKEEKIIYTTPSIQYVKSTSVFSTNILQLEEISGEIDIGKMRVVQVDAIMNVEHTGNILFDDYSQESRQNIEKFIEPLKYTKYSRGVLLKCEFPKEIEHALYNHLPTIFANPFIIITIIQVQEGIYIFPVHDKLFNFVEKVFYQDINSTIENLFKYTYYALKSCPCEKGCSKCIYYAYHKDTDGLDKEEFGGYLSKFFGPEEEQNYKNLIGFRNGTIKSISKLTNFYNKIKRKVINILINNLDIVLRNPVPLKVVKNLTAGVLGNYDGKNVKVIPLKQQKAISVITHEYIHNWQDEIGILQRKDKFIVEGSAQWLATKVLNYYYRIDEIEIDIMGTSSKETREYFNGFQFLQEVEGKFGYTNILNRVISDEWTAEQLKIKQKWKEYRLP